MALRLIHYGGGEVKDLGWSADTGMITAHMDKVTCNCGATQINDALARFLEDKVADQARAIILVGDSFEEKYQRNKTARDPSRK